MATSLRRSRLIPARSGGAYRLEMEGRTLALLVGLLALTGVVTFALGVVTGMGMRVPATAIPVATQPPQPPQQDVPPVSQQGLAFNKGLKAPEPTIEGLKINAGDASKQTDTLLKRARELTLEEIPQPGAARAQKTPAKLRSADVPPAPPPVQARPAPLEKELFTVQVFSSRQRKNARDLMERLRKQGFGAYMNQFQGSDGQTWFRVRVGKNGRSGAEKLVKRLREKAKMKAPRIIRL